MIKPATAWYRFKDGKWKYNHFEYGINKDTPTPESEAQQAWKDWLWAKKYGYYQNALGRTKLVTESPLHL